jgi:hypothetical protein
MCYVWDEVASIFVPWGANSDLRLVKGGPFWSLGESTAGIALAEVRKLREELEELKSSMVSGGSGSFAGSHVRKFTSEQNVSSSLWRETAALFFVQDPKMSSGSPWMCEEPSHTIVFSPLLAADKGASTCFGHVEKKGGWPGCYSTSTSQYASTTQFRFTAMQSSYMGSPEDDLSVSAHSSDFCLGSRLRVSSLQLMPDRTEITNFGGSFIVSQPLHHQGYMATLGLGAGYQPVAVALLDGRGVLFVNFHAGQNYRYEETQRSVHLWGDVANPSMNETLIQDFTLADNVFGHFRAGPLLHSYLNPGQRYDCGWDDTGWWQCRTTDEPNFAFGRAHVATAHTGQHVWFAGGLEVTGDGPQGNVIRYNQADPESSGHTPHSPQVLPSLRALTDVDILNVETGNWSKASLSSPRFGVSGAGVDSFIVFAGGAQLGSPDSQAVVEELTWQVNVSSCQGRRDAVYSQDAVFALQSRAAMIFTDDRDVGSLAHGGGSLRCTDEHANSAPSPTGRLLLKQALICQQLALSFDTRFVCCPIHVAQACVGPCIHQSSHQLILFHAPSHLIFHVLHCQGRQSLTRSAL